MRQMQPWPRWFAWAALPVASLMLLLALTNLIINTEKVGSWLYLLLVSPLLLYIAIWSLRHHAQSL